MTWLPSQGTDSDFDAVFTLRPDMHAAYREFYALFWQQRLVDPVLLEISRLRIARLCGCESETRLRYRPAIDAGFCEEQAVAALTGDHAGLLDPLQIACLSLAEKFVLDVHSITDDDIAVVRDAIGEEALVALTEALALFDGFARFRAILGIGVDGGAVTVVDAPTIGVGVS